MGAKRVVGIDFGTSTSVVRVKRYEQSGLPLGDRLAISNVIFDGYESVPTLVQIPEDVVIVPELKLPDEDYEFGRFAASEQPGMRTWRNFKTELESSDKVTRNRARWLTSRFFEYLYRQYRQQILQLGDSGDEEIVYVSYPAKYGPAEREFMISVATEAGFRNVRGITEPEAAVKALMVQGEKDLREQKLLREEGPSYLLFADMGAGTTDLAVCRYEKGRTEIITTWPDDKTPIYFGGKEIDGILCGYVEDYLKKHGDIVPAYFADHFREKYIEAVKTWKEVTVSRSLKRGREVPYFEAVKNPYPLLPDFSPAISRTELEKTAGGYLKNFAVLINGCLQEASKADADFPGGEGIDLVLLTGGHSQWYFIPEILTGKAVNLGEVSLPKIQAEPSRIRISGKPQDTVAVGMVYGLLREAVEAPGKPVGKRDENWDENQVEKRPDTEIRQCSEKTAATVKQTQSFQRPIAAARPSNGILTKDLAKQMFSGKTAIIVPDGFTEIGEEAFNYFLSNTVKGTLGNLFAKNPPSPTSVQLPKGLRHIRKSAFEHCVDLWSVDLPDGLISIGNMAFEDCKSLRDVTIPDSVKTIGARAFAGCARLGKINIPAGVTEIGAHAFYACEYLENVAIQRGTQIIGESAFAMCRMLKSISLPEGIRVIGASAFSGCTWGVRDIELPDSVREIGHSAFSNCKALGTIKIPEGVRSISWETFKNCTGLSSITIPDSVREIGNNAFLGCRSYLTICCHSGSFAESYAREHGYTIKLI